MKIEIHDVDHGACTVFTSPQGHRMMLDCGSSSTRSWFPSSAYAKQTFDLVGLQNLDEDHVQDLPQFWANTSILGLVSNPTVSATALKAMKSGGMGPGVAKAHEIIRRFGPGGVGRWQGYLGGVTWQAFYNRYAADFIDTNNLSLAFFVTWGRFTILLGGDMECAGWEKLLQNPHFVARLREVNVYVASHHGRENGKCDALFKHMRPDVVIFSDGPKRHGTQETRDWYAGRVKGIPDNSKAATAAGPPVRKVMTTRNDGTLTINVGPTGNYTVLYSKSEPTIQEVMAMLFPPQPPLSKLLSGFP